ncbi:hypothetical protein M413DRAFT_438683 [Hebeloma cylindrosporum]|uniref:Postreplication repair E3 ubiquitin-protein ligase RAD18 n=1 Tax=Hebeloma cylindrosporum TaxID=76867 RepID=A0A0C3CZB2_HEBCY|nr:hypothetical protein M413DRAFT_438683 [Hebeloma cylindrosporum h7]
MNFLDADVPDPTDFPPHSTAPGLRALDGAFRCDICGELYDGPVTISCGHCFCSACIRMALANKQECPSCRKSAGEAHIRPNPVLENVISSWKEARPFILGLVRREMEHATTPQATTDKGTVRKRKRSVENSSSFDTLGSGVAGPSSYPISPSRGPAALLKSPSRPKKPKSAAQEIIDMTVPSSDIEEDETTPPNLAPKADEIVACPICQKHVRYRSLNAHIDRDCKDIAPSFNTVNSWSKIMGTSKNGQNKGKHKKTGSDSDDEYPLPISTYTTLKDKQLKDMLTQQNLPVTGDRSIWEQRHQRWVMLYNANLDKSLANRKTKAELRKDLKRWEEERTRKKKTAITDVKGYQIENKSEFNRLINAARPKAPSRSTIHPTSSPPSETKGPPLLSQLSLTEAGDSIV